MARLLARGLLTVFASLSACRAPAQPAAIIPKPAPPASAPAQTEPLPPPPAVTRAAPTRPLPAVLWATTKLRNFDYVSVREVAKQFGFKLAWAKPDLAMTLSDVRGVRFIFENNQKDFYFDGLRIFLGTPAVRHKDSLWISLLDVIKLVAPLARPADHVAQLPVAAPRTIVLDPGHGGIDPGTQNLKLGLNEKTVTLDVAARLRKILETTGWKVLLVRERDTELSKDKKADLLMRDEFANRNHADLYLSIHFNSAGPAVAGVETYALAPQFMLSAGDETGDDMTKAAYPSNRLDTANLIFGEHLHRAMIAGLRTPDRGYKHARKAVLRMLDCPGALVECGYLSNDTEARRISTPEFRQQIAESLAAGVQNYAGALATLRLPAPVPEPAKSK